MLAAALASVCVVPDAGAVFTLADTNAPYGITLQVGSASAIDEVVFNVTGANAGLSPAPVAGVNSTTGQSGVTVQISPSRPSQLFAETRPVTLTVDSSIALSCTTSALCGSTTIPFTSISWTSTNATNPNQGDIQSGIFSGTAGQQLASFNAATSTFFGIFNAETRFMSNTLNFVYSNSTIYPAGTYRGSVRFTATMV